MREWKWCGDLKLWNRNRVEKCKVECTAWGLCLASDVDPWNYLEVLNQTALGNLRVKEILKVTLYNELQSYFILAFIHRHFFQQSLLCRFNGFFLFYSLNDHPLTLNFCELGLKGEMMSWWSFLCFIAFVIDVESSFLLSPSVSLRNRTNTRRPQGKIFFAFRFSKFSLSWHSKIVDPNFSKIFTSHTFFGDLLSNKKRNE